MTRVLVVFCKLISKISTSLGIGAGATWPGEIALTISPHILKDLSKSLRKGIILVAGTNGKTTTSLMISRILTSQNERVILNNSGANLINGVVSALIKNADWSGKIQSDWGVFEVDENSLPLVLPYLKPRIVVLTNLFRDQLDRYGEVDVIAEKWQKALKNLFDSGNQYIKSDQVTLILNSDDPQIAYLGRKVKCTIKYFGIEDKKYFLKIKEHATDSIFCLNCKARLSYHGVYYSHVGDWYCKKCGEKRPKPNLSYWDVTLPGIYNIYNTLAAVSTGKALSIPDNIIKSALKNFSPAFGRQEEFVVNGKKVKLFLSKNPVGFNESLKTVIGLGAKTLLLILNDRIPDGRDVSWIWDVDFEILPDNVKIIVSGERTYDLAVRIKYALKSQNDKLKVKTSQSDQKLVIEPELEMAIKTALIQVKQGETLYILPTYSAMLEVRKILTGRKIL